jgi:nitrate reductase beta subunit
MDTCGHILSTDQWLFNLIKHCEHKQDPICSYLSANDIFLDPVDKSNPVIDSILHNGSYIVHDMVDTSTNAPIHSNLVDTNANAPIHGNLVDTNANAPIHSNLVDTNANAPIHSNLVDTNAILSTAT